MVLRHDTTLIAIGIDRCQLTYHLRPTGQVPTRRAGGYSESIASVSACACASADGAAGADGAAAGTGDCRAARSAPSAGAVAATTTTRELLCDDSARQALFAQHRGIPPPPREISGPDPLHAGAKPAASTPRRDGRVKRTPDSQASGRGGPKQFAPAYMCDPDTAAAVLAGVGPDVQVLSETHDEEVPPVRVSKADILHKEDVPLVLLGPRALDFDGRETVVLSYDGPVGGSQQAACLRRIDHELLVSDPHGLGCNAQHDLSTSIVQVSHVCDSSHAFGLQVRHVQVVFDLGFPWVEGVVRTQLMHEIDCLDGIQNMEMRWIGVHGGWDLENSGNHAI
jgi:hypothetical protein